MGSLPKFWELINEQKDFYEEGPDILTYERQLSNGTLVLVVTMWKGTITHSATFVPAPNF